MQLRDKLNEIRLRYMPVSKDQQQAEDLQRVIDSENEPKTAGVCSACHNKGYSHGMSLDGKTHVMFCRCFLGDELAKMLLEAEEKAETRLLRSLKRAVAKFDEPKSKAEIDDRLKS